MWCRCWPDWRCRGPWRAEVGQKFDACTADVSLPVIRCARSSGLHLVELVASVASHLRCPELLLLVPVLA